MDVKKVFRNISSKMLHDFKISAEINHQVVKGTYREGALKKFLSEGRLPARYEIGSGEIIGPANNVSKQSDLIIYDHLNGFSLVYDDSIQIYPIECIAGIIEVKSTLNKAEFIKALDNIKSVKQLVPDETVSKQLAGTWRMAYKRPLPFGIIFAYRVLGNSINSLQENLLEWGASVPRELWPNLVVVLDEGLIQHYKGISTVFSSLDISESTSVTAIHYKQDSLFKFYAALMDMLSSTELGPVEISRYFSPLEKMGDLFVGRHIGYTKQDDDSVYKISENFIRKIYNYCIAKGPITHKELMIARFGSCPSGLESLDMDATVYFYNPENLKGIHETPNSITVTDGEAVFAQNLIEPCQYITINDDTFYFPGAYLKNEDLEIAPNMTKQDL